MTAIVSLKTICLGLALIAYGILTWRSLYEASLPILPCHESSSVCFHPAIRVDEHITLQLQLWMVVPPEEDNKTKKNHRRSSSAAAASWVSIPTCRLPHVVLPSSGSLPKVITRSTTPTTMAATAAAATDNITNTTTTTCERQDQNKTSTALHSSCSVATDATAKHVPPAGSAASLCQLELPNFARYRSQTKAHVHPLQARFLVYRHTEHSQQQNSSPPPPQLLLALEPFSLTRIVERAPVVTPTWKSATKLIRANEHQNTETNETKNNSYNNTNWLTGTSSSSSSSSVTLETNSSSSSSMEDASVRKNTMATTNQTMYIPYLKYGRSTAIRIRYVTEERAYGYLQRSDGIRLQALNQSYYRPRLYVDEVALQQRAHVELAPPRDAANKPPILLHIKFNAISPLVDTVYQQVRVALDVLETSTFLQQEPDLLDEVKYFLQDEKLYRFFLTNILSTVHVWLDYLAFRDEVRFYHGRTTFSGISSSTAITRMICSLIITLYLLDGGGTSWLVLVSLMSTLAVDIWKVWKLLTARRRHRHRSQKSSSTSSSSSSKTHEMEELSHEEQQTAEYDTIAYRYLSLVFYPLVMGWSIYALREYEYKSVYSWFISNCANAVYTFGFISLCPQLYINYRLKSVAHLPWKVFGYKIFTTFVDDAFAWLIEMPMKHRLMTLRDDVVFLVFLYQAYIYRVDKSRNNEYGYSYQNDDNDGDNADIDDNINNKSNNNNNNDGNGDQLVITTTASDQYHEGEGKEQKDPSIATTTEPTSVKQINGLTKLATATAMPVVSTPTRRSKRVKLINNEKQKEKNNVPTKPNDEDDGHKMKKE